jgi:anti-sigma regulatory factor (Ser/Thr protein kinase)
MTDGATMTVSVRLERTPLAVRTARRTMLHLLGDGPSISFVRDAVLLTSELVSNALMHTSGSFELGATYRTRPDRLRVEVSDDSSAMAMMAEPPIAPARGGGLGLRLVNDVADAWGTEQRNEGGKTVWFEMTATDRQEQS